MTETTTASSKGVRLALAGLLLAALSGCHREESASERLRTLAPRSERPIEARLTGLDWQSMRRQRATQAGLMDPSRLALAGAASAVIQSRSGDTSAAARHESGAAYLLIERDRDAVDALESSTQQSPKDAGAWSDLSAARYTLAVREKRPHLLPQALADADHALTIAPNLPDALFNRALIVEALGISEAARRAWQRYLVVDPSSHWSNEATEHLGSLRVVPTGDDFRRKLGSASRALREGNRAPVVALARNFPQEARTWSEGPLLADWADAVRAGKTKKAAESLSVVRELGSALADFNHDESVADAVAAIDRADSARLRTLAEAHAIYRDGRLLYRDRRVGEAEQQLRRAADLFNRAGSPMAFRADYYAASCLFDRNRPAEASKAFDELAAHFDRKRYPALTAEVGWEKTLCEASAGEWEAAIRTASESRKIFTTLGETQNRGEMDILLASRLNQVSQPAAAWKARTAAFPILSGAGLSERIRTSLISSIYSEAAQGKFEVALSLANIALDDLHHTRMPIAISAAEALRAEALANLGYSRAAAKAIERARETAKVIPDIELQHHTLTTVDIAEGVVARATNTNSSLRLLNAAIAFYAHSRDNAWLPRAYLERGRTYVRAKNDVAAIADFEAGLREVDAERFSISNREVRGTFYDTEPELFSEAIALELRRGDTVRAFEFSDGARARSLYEQIGSHGQVVEKTTARIESLRRALPPGTALIEYSLLHNSIAIFYFSPSGSGVVNVPGSAVVVRRLVEDYDDLLQHRGELSAFQEDAAALYGLLIAPIAAKLAGVDRLIVVPDRELQTIPFAALYDARRGRYLVDDFAVSVAPSAAWVLQPRIPRNLTAALVIGDPHNEDEPSLPEAAREAKAIAAMYDSSTLLVGETATRERFIMAAARSGLIHYAGHAQSDAADPFGSLHFASDRANESGDLDANAIAALHLSNSPLVVLAACGTMRGDSEHVEGMPSIARAFLAAGARNVVGTLWEVDDDMVAPLFRRMHRELRLGRDTAAALRIAQVALAHDPDSRLRHPATWAPVELLGYSNEVPATTNKRSK